MITVYLITFSLEKTKFDCIEICRYNLDLVIKKYDLSKVFCKQRVLVVSLLMYMCASIV